MPWKSKITKMWKSACIVHFPTCLFGVQGKDHILKLTHVKQHEFSELNQPDEEIVVTAIDQKQNLCTKC